VSNLCKNQATCQSGFTAKGYRCLCTAGFEGEYCEIGEFLFLSNNVQSVFNQLYNYVESIILIASSKFARVDAKVWQRLIFRSMHYRPRINAAFESEDCGARTDPRVPPSAFLQAITYMLSLPDLGSTSNWLNGCSTRSNQKHYPDLVSDTSSVWNFCPRCSDVISGGKFKVVASWNVDCFLKLVIC